MSQGGGHFKEIQRVQGHGSLKRADQTVDWPAMGVRLQHGLGVGAGQWDCSLQSGLVHGLGFYPAEGRAGVAQRQPSPV